MKLLLVDDDAFLRDMYGTKFSQEGHEIDVADSGTVALSKVERNQDYDAVLLDMIMPGMSGLELIKKLKQSYPNLKMKYIVLSNQGQSEDINEAKSEGADGYIVKANMIPSEVVKKVNKICGNKK